PDPLRQRCILSQDQTIRNRVRARRAHPFLRVGHIPSSGLSKANWSRIVRASRPLGPTGDRPACPSVDATKRVPEMLRHLQIAGASDPGRPVVILLDRRGGESAYKLPLLITRTDLPAERR